MTLPALCNADATQTVAMLSPQQRPFPLDRKGIFPSGRFYPAIALHRAHARHSLW
jgi:hypothetical protein